MEGRINFAGEMTSFFEALLTIMNTSAIELSIIQTGNHFDRIGKELTSIYIDSLRVG
jgi:hypothetical protein